MKRHSLLSQARDSHLMTDVRPVVGGVFAMTFQEGRVIITVQKLISLYPKFSASKQRAGDARRLALQLQSFTVRSKAAPVTVLLPFYLANFADLKVGVLEHERHRVARLFRSYKRRGQFHGFRNHIRSKL